MHEGQPDFSKDFDKLRGDVGDERMLVPEVSVKQLENLCNGNEHLVELLQGTLEQCARYTEDVTRFLQVEAMGKEAKESGEFYEIDTKRTRTHNATIDSINILARELSRCGRDGSWVKKFAGNRVAYMRFALRLTFNRMQPQEK